MTKRKKPAKLYTIHCFPNGDVSRGECLLCNKYFYTTLKPATAVKDIMDQIYAHLDEKHGPKV
jgi:hypothetical protein